MREPDGLWTYRANFHRVVDGDTVVMTVDHGMRIQSVQSIRLAGVNAPELDEDQGPVTAVAVSAWFDAHDEHVTADAFAWGFRMVTIKDRRSFNRYDWLGVPPGS